jgi:hypothetical protein
MKATCPKNPKHRQFVTVASVLEEWVVDEHGNWISTEQALQTNHGPDSGNIWTCFICGAKARVED